MEDAIRVSIGSEPSQWVPMLVLQYSIIRRTKRTVEFTESWNPEQGWHPLLKSKTPLQQGTRFSAWRWIVPELYGNEGKAIYLDADQVLLSDIGELWDMLESDKMFAAVCNVDPSGLWGKRTLEKSGKKYKNKVQTSVMAMNCRQCEWDAERLFQEIKIGRKQYAELMQADFIPRERIQELSPRWNDFGIAQNDTKLVHYSHVASQPWSPRWRGHKPGHPLTDQWHRELQAAVDSGFLSLETLHQEVEAKHIHKFFQSRKAA